MILQFGVTVAEISPRPEIINSTGLGKQTHRDKKAQVMAAEKCRSTNTTLMSVKHENKDIMSSKSRSVDRTLTEPETSNRNQFITDWNINSSNANSGLREKP